MKARLLFQRLTSREKTLLCAFIWVILVICIAFAFRNFRVFLGAWSDTGGQLKVQQGSLDLAPLITAQLDQELEFFSSDRILDSAKLTGRVDELARQTGISNYTYTTRSEMKDIHVEHTIRLNIRDTTMEDLMALDAVLDEESPYINKVAVSIDAKNNNSTLLDATVLLNSFELKPSGLTATQ
ncbi:hypothetical protein [Cerasicoccus arenae]|uniref:Uncharacterized protein n=1 Tax=Cerasicoccus arenae TaxID=424488 RepID=A0A8J3GCZ8_9BACT|nr:hypothetical protein [Cerasicoccus arenae]MBK1857965.1 hypothetical protein [Cerasicoccus arenae]GHB97779.1 hypothetical protein GCM10007047_12080 [Cerasicoccus arenae]